MMDDMPPKIATPAADIDEAVLAKVRALLAKAESTTFVAEAEALIAKAHQLMARHAIDRAMLGDRDAASAVTSRRVTLDDPYLRAKYLLLAEVARASSCRALLHTRSSYATVFGYPADLDAVDLLYTSLLLQATAGALGARPDDRRRAYAASQVAAYRRAWLVAFARRVGERLHEASAAVVDEAEAEHGDALLPVLAAKDDAVEAALQEAAPSVRMLRTRVSSGEGWADGRAAGDRASLAHQTTLGHRRGELP